HSAQETKSRSEDEVESDTTPQRSTPPQAHEKPGRNRSDTPTAQVKKEPSMNSTQTLSPPYATISPWLS
ncbi:hypothetical protein ABTK41_20065, partial [Acinetobacter baumannii]